MAKSQSGSPLGYVSFRGPVSTRLRATPAGYRRCSASQSSSIGRVKRMCRPTRWQGRRPARTAS